MDPEDIRVNEQNPFLGWMKNNVARANRRRRRRRRM